MIMNYDDIYYGYFGLNYIGEWHWFDEFKDAKDNEEVYGLTEDGDNLFTEWCDDSSLGYDLCYGRMKGLANKYDFAGIVNKIINDDELSVKIEDYE